ncbi:D-glycero-alpha-D-manno-heptose-1,7-bisphosphate 7-phosphatase [Methylocella silvestris]|uniref:D,D-heptose 1,7-bisphosphate phosphatase n=1 Tax=Methylocella silvestris TaxID=199596 RepID=A0A2J7TJA9_METSI|nr:HAD family hydrolase [Methylocella silvestris]PNG26849.1 HAD family hydrolase [Methylocella silvestris]
MLSPAIFLDRDGTIIIEKNYPSDPDQVGLLPGAVDGLKAMARRGFPLVVVSNQSGIGRGYFSVEQADAVQERVRDLLAREGVEIAGWYRCPHGPGEDCACRKPAPGMIQEAARDLHLDPARSFVIGDKWSDVELAAAVGAAGLLVVTGHGYLDAERARGQGVPVCRDLVAASEEIDRLLALQEVAANDL